jgi:choline dehydrogenase-like flavoprotein
MVQNNPIDYWDYLGMVNWRGDRIDDYVSPNPKLPENQNIKYYGESLSQESLNQGAQNLEDLGKGIMSTAYGAAKDGVDYLKNEVLDAAYDAAYDAVTDYFEPNQNNRRGDGRRGRGGRRGPSGPTPPKPPKPSKDATGPTPPKPPKPPGTSKCK